MATPNYSYEKRQRELAKKRKKEEKAMRKSSGPGDQPESEPGNEASQGLTEPGQPAAGEPAPSA